MSSLSTPPIKSKQRMMRSAPGLVFSTIDERDTKRRRKEPSLVTDDVVMEEAEEFVHIGDPCLPISIIRTGTSKDLVIGNDSFISDDSFIGPRLPPNHLIPQQQQAANIKKRKRSETVGLSPADFINAPKSACSFCDTFDEPCLSCPAGGVACSDCFFSSANGEKKNQDIFVKREGIVDTMASIPDGGRTLLVLPVRGSGINLTAINGINFNAFHRSESASPSTSVPATQNKQQLNQNIIDTIKNVRQACYDKVAKAAELTFEDGWPMNNGFLDMIPDASKYLAPSSAMMAEVPSERSVLFVGFSSRSGKLRLNAGQLAVHKPPSRRLLVHWSRLINLSSLLDSIGVDRVQEIEAIKQQDHEEELNLAEGEQGENAIMLTTLEGKTCFVKRNESSVPAWYLPKTTGEKTSTARGHKGLAGQLTSETSDALAAFLRVPSNAVMSRSLRDVVALRCAPYKQDPFALLDSSPATSAWCNCIAAVMTRYFSAQNAEFSFHAAGVYKALDVSKAEAGKGSWWLQLQSLIDQAVKASSSNASGVVDMAVQIFVEAIIVMANLRWSDRHEAVKSYIDMVAGELLRQSFSPYHDELPTTTSAGSSRALYRVRELWWALGVRVYLCGHAFIGPLPDESMAGYVDEYLRACRS